jgi:glycosyltransferase involved in cell wall biosynthesis
MDIFVLPSYNEGMGRALVEAMGAGLAVVATAVGGVPAVVDGGVDGLLVRPRAPTELAAAIALLATDPAGRQRLGRQARRKAQQFSVAAMVRAIETLYVELIEEKQRAATAPV